MVSCGRVGDYSKTERKLDKHRQNITDAVIWSAEAFDIKKTDFNAVLLESVDDALLALGENARRALCFQVEKRFQVRHDEIPERVVDFHKALVGLFASGSNHLENIMVKEMCERLGLTFKEHKNWSLVEYVEDATKNRENLLGVRS